MPKRFNIYKELDKAKDHSSTDKIFQRVRNHSPHISFDTVNRTVLTFAERGIIRVVEGYQGGGRCIDPNMDSHHLRCFKCYTIIDFYDKTYDALKLPKTLPEIFQVLNKKSSGGVVQKSQKSKGG